MSENVKEVRSRTLISTETCNFTWSIENFSLCGLQGEEYMNSPIFTTGCGSSLLTTWSLKLYPNRNKTAEKDGSVGIFLAQTPTNSSAHYATFKISIIDSSQAKRYCRKACHLYNETESDWGYKEFIKRSELFGQEQSSLLPQDILTVMCELKTSRVDEYKASSPTELSKPTTSSPVVFTKPDSLTRDLQHLYDSKMYSDLTLKVGVELFEVHKNILCARSSVFNTMLNCEMKEKLTNCVEIIDFDPPTVKMMLHYIYCGKVEDLNPEIGIQLYSVAEKYNLQDLKNICVEYLSRNLNVDNFCDVIMLGKLHNEPGLMTDAKGFFCANATIIKGTEKWHSLSTTNPDLVIAMYEVILSKIQI